jgi:transcriptional regulator with XRE-family HTH domain
MVGRRRDMTINGGAAKRKAHPVNKPARTVLRELRTRAGLSAAEIARKLGYASTNGYIKYEYEEQGDRLIPYRVIRGVMPLFVGRGTPPITADELISISEARTLKQDAAGISTPPSVVQFPPQQPTSGKFLTIRFRVEAGVYVDAPLAGTRTYGEAPMGYAFDFVAESQFAALLVGNGNGGKTVFHCVTPDQIGPAQRRNRRAIVLRPRGASDLVEVTLATLNTEGEPPAGERIVGLVIGVYSRE